MHYIATQHATHISLTSAFLRHFFPFFLCCASCFSTLLSCSYKFPRASISQHSMLTRALFLYYCAFFVVSNHSLSYYPTALSNIIVVQYKTGSLTGLGKLWQLHNMTTFGLLFIQFKGTRLTGFFPNQSKHSTTLVKHHVHVSCHAFCQLSFCSDMFTKFTIKTVG